jgi:hypothetical protein
LVVTPGPLDWGSLSLEITMKNEQKKIEIRRRYASILLGRSIRTVRREGARAYWGTDQMSTVDHGEWMATHGVVLRMRDLEWRLRTGPREWPDFVEWSRGLLGIDVTDRRENEKRDRRDARNAAQRPLWMNRPDLLPKRPPHSERSEPGDDS